MKKRLLLVFAVTLLTSSDILFAQTEKDEIIIVTKEGENDVMDVPVGMTLEVDSLLNLFNSKT